MRETACSASDGGERRGAKTRASVAIETKARLKKRFRPSR